MGQQLGTLLPRIEAPAAPPLRHPGLAGLPEDRARSGGVDATMFTAAMFTAQILLFVAGVVQKRLLGPTAAGYWALVTTFSVLFNLTALGALDGAGRQIPQHRGRGDFARAASAADTGGSFALLTTLIAGSSLAAVALIFGAGWNPELRFGLVLLGLIAPIQKLADAHETIMQATKRFYVSSLVALVGASITVVLQTGAVWLLGYYGMFVGQVLIVLGALCVWNRLGLTSVHAPVFRWRIDRTRLRELTRFGIPITLNGQLWALFLVIDNLIVVSFLSVRELGYYALACSATTYIMVVPKSLGAALAPRMSERFGKTGSAAAIGRYSSDSQQLLAFMLLPVMVGAAFFFMPVLIRHALPAFVPAVAVVRIVVAGSFFVSLTTLPTKVMLAAGYRWSVAGLTLAALVVNAGANVVAVVILHGGLTGAALAVAFSYGAAFLLMTMIAETRTGSREGRVRHVAEIFAAFAYTLAAMWGIELLLGGGGGSLIGDAAAAVGKFGLLVILLTPLLVVAERRTRAGSALRSMFIAAFVRVFRRGSADA